MVCCEDKAADAFKSLFVNDAPVDATETEAAEAVPTPAPTSHYDEWTVYFTDGIEGESYVWWMESEKSGVYASVLVDTTGYASGLAVAANETTCFFSDYTGSIYKVDNDGLGLIELISYGGTPMGMDLYEYYDAIYWADAMGYVYKSALDGTKMETILDTCTEPIDVKVNMLQSEIYVAANEDNKIVRADLDGGNAEKFLSVSLPHGLWVDPDNHLLYFTSMAASSGEDDSGFVATCSMMEGTYPNTTKIIEGITPYGVAVDEKRNLLFVTTDEELNLHDIDGTFVETVAGLENLQFVYVVAWTSPTPAPTALPTPVPTSVPTSVPTASSSSAVA